MLDVAEFAYATVSLPILSEIEYIQRRFCISSVSEPVYSAFILLIEYGLRVPDVRMLNAVRMTSSVSGFTFPVRCVAETSRNFMSTGSEISMAKS